MKALHQKTILITGASRGIGREIALRCAQDGANVVIAAKSATPHPKLPGTIYTVAEEVNTLGGQALAFQLDVRDDEQVTQLIDKTIDTFGGIDAIINNAGAIKLCGAEALSMKRFDLMHQINTRAVLSLAKAALPWLKKSENGHIISLSPPLNLDPKWFAQYAPYTITKYGMTMLTMGLSQEFRRFGIAVNSLWPRTIISTAAIEFEGGGKAMMSKGRTPQIMADAAYAILTTTECSLTGQAIIDENLLRERGFSDFDEYRFDSESNKPLMTDLFLHD